MRTFTALPDRPTRAPSEVASEDVVSDSPRFECDLCGNLCGGRPSSSGLFIWHRGDELRYEEPPLCESCSGALTLGAVWRWTEMAGGED